MDPVHNTAEQDLDEMRQEIDCTRSAMTDKLEALEDQVLGTVQSAREAVEDSIQTARDTVEETVATVKTSVRETVATVKRTFDIEHQVQQHPWAMVGGSFLAGLALGSLFQRMRQRSRPAPDRLTANEASVSTSPAPPSPHRGNGSSYAADPQPQLKAAAASQPGFLDQFHEEIDKVKGIAISYVMGLVRDSIHEYEPQLTPQIDDVMNSITTKLGGKPLPEHLRSH